MLDSLFENPLSPGEYNPLYATARGLCGHFFHNLGHLDVRGAEWVPATGPFLLASNHASFIDPPLLAVACPGRRQLHFFARKTLFKGAFGRLIEGLQAIPIDRDGDSDIGAFRKVFSILESGHPLLVFPEGTRTNDGKLQPARRGIGLIACKAQVPVVPAFIRGSFESWGRNQRFPDLFVPLRVDFGKPVYPSEYDPGRPRTGDRFQKAADRIMSGIEDLERLQKEPDNVTTFSM